MADLTRPEGSERRDFDLTRRVAAASHGFQAHDRAATCDRLAAEDGRRRLAGFDRCVRRA